MTTRDGFDERDDAPAPVVQGQRPCRACSRPTATTILANRAGMCIGCFERYVRQPAAAPLPPTYLGRQIKAGVTGRLRGISSLAKSEAGIAVELVAHDEVSDDKRLADLKLEARRKAEAYAKAHGIAL